MHFEHSSYQNPTIKSSYCHIEILSVEFCQAQIKLQLQLQLELRLALIKINPTTHSPTHLTEKVLSVVLDNIHKLSFT